ncbi:MAG: hypothetical protein QNJ20_08145 [Paracoccaceae bacterium]|nr:hypothetical protein [Paracoccaceae bacterium]
MICRTLGQFSIGCRPDRRVSTAAGLIASGLLAIAAIVYAGLLVSLLGAALYTAPSAWQGTPTLVFLATGVAIACASAGLFVLATVPFRAVAHFWAAGDAISLGEVPRKMKLGTFYGLVSVVAIFAVASILPVLDGEYARQPWISTAFQMTLLGAPSVLAAIALRAEAVMRRGSQPRQGVEAE